MVNLETSSNEFAKFTQKMNNGNGALSKLMDDEEFSKSLDTTMANIQGATKGLNESMEAAKSNFLLRGYFKKKEKAEAKKLEEAKKLKAASPDAAGNPEDAKKLTGAKKPDAKKP
jgi:phospholipid/cholesterol/gamma-HCH transport system substrate-binding protein